MQRELGGILSPKPLIFGEHDTRYENATQPWNTVVTPHIQLVIQPGEEADVPTIVSYCNEHSPPFLARGRAQGGSSSLNSFAGIQIDLSPFSDITITPPAPPPVSAAASPTVKPCPTSGNEAT
ncbi:hypothetical protein BDW71DRAFT_203671 [Aspergillus fruticulosus]